MPASAFLELAIAAARSCLTPAARLQLASAGITAPLPLPPVAPHPAAREVAISVVLRGGELKVRSCRDAQDDAATAPAGLHMDSIIQALHRSVADLGWTAEPRMPPLVPCQLARASVQGAACDSLALVPGLCTRGAADAAAYYLHPAIADCCLHLGAVPAAAAAEPVCRVPVGIEAYMAPAETPLVLTGWAVAARPQAAGPAATSMLWRPGSNAGTGCQLLGLHTKPMPQQQVSFCRAKRQAMLCHSLRQANGLLQAACAVRGAQGRMLYEVQVQAATPAVRASKVSCAVPRGAQLQAIGGKAQRMRTGFGRCGQEVGGRGASAQAFLRALAFVQQSMAVPPPCAVSALLRLDTGGSQAATLRAAAVWGLLRTAALEHPDGSRSKPFFSTARPTLSSRTGWAASDPSWRGRGKRIGGNRRRSKP